MKRTLIILACAACTLAVAQKRPEPMVPPGAAAPAFSVPGADGKTYRLSDYKGKYVVLEWTNKDCPYVLKHYNSGNMQQTQQKARDMGAVWFSVISSAEGQQGYLTADDATRHYKEVGSHANAILLDTTGSIGLAYGARNTPQIVIVGPDGNVVYHGAIDNRPSPDRKSLAGATNYVLQALEESMASKPVTTPSSRPYGCRVHY